MPTRSPTSERPAPRRSGGEGATGRDEARAQRQAAARRRRAVTLATSVVRTSRSAMALVRDGELLVRNRAWNALTRRRGAAWRGEGRLYATLPAIGSALSSEMLAAGEVVREARLERDDPAQVLAVRCERLARPGRPVVLVVVRDVSERVWAEREVARARELLAEQERIRAVGELASGVAHDLNNVLHAMRLRLDALRRAELGPEARDGAAALVRMVEEAACRVARLQDLAYRRRDAPVGDVDLAAVVREAADAARPELERAGRGRRGVVRVEQALPSLPRVRGSASELRDVFVSLLLNARDAMPDGGAVRISGEAMGGRAVVRVADDGHGIPEDVLPRIFDPFFTTKGRRGSGLGLAIARSVMLRLGGEIRATSAPPQGAVFELSFPVADGEARAAPPPRAHARPGRRVLVVDDDEDVLDAARLVLEDLGEHVETAASGREALARVLRGDRFDVVLCDIGMPDLSGWQVTEELRELLPRAELYLVTGWAHEIPPDDPRRAGVRDVLPKPLPLDRLEEILAPRPPQPAPAPGGRPGGPVHAT